MWYNAAHENQNFPFRGDCRAFAPRRERRRGRLPEAHRRGGREGRRPRSGACGRTRDEVPPPQEPRRAAPREGRGAARQRAARGLLRLPRGGLRGAPRVVRTRPHLCVGRGGHRDHGRGDCRRTGPRVLPRAQREPVVPRPLAQARTAASARGAVRPLPRCAAPGRDVQGLRRLDDAHTPVRERVRRRNPDRQRPARDQLRRNRLRRVPARARRELDVQDWRRLPHPARDAREARRRRGVRRRRRLELRPRQRVPDDTHRLPVGRAAPRCRSSSRMA